MTSKKKSDILSLVYTRSKVVDATHVLWKRKTSYGFDVFMLFSAGYSECFRVDQQISGLILRVGLVYENMNILSQCHFAWRFEGLSANHLPSRP